MAKPSERYLQGKPSGGCKELGPAQRRDTDVQGILVPSWEPFSLQIKSCLGPLDATTREEVSGQANRSPEGCKDKPRKSPSQQPLTKHLHSHVLLMPAIIKTLFTAKERSVNIMGLWVWSSLPSDFKQFKIKPVVLSSYYSNTLRISQVLCQHHSFKVKNAPPHTHTQTQSLSLSFHLYLKNQINIFHSLQCLPILPSLMCDPLLT